MSNKIIWDKWEVQTSRGHISRTQRFAFWLERHGAENDNQQLKTVSDRKTSEAPGGWVGIETTSNQARIPFNQARRQKRLDPQVFVKY